MDGPSHPSNSLHKCHPPPPPSTPSILAHWAFALGPFGFIYRPSPISPPPIPNHFGIPPFPHSANFPHQIMHQFHRYDPAQPRTVTSFKGNQKLIFEGYRYNIHHIVPTKGVKTWRCVCAKKLNGSRSWCKGRAETWDGDSQGVSKGEHNHPPEHEVAELDFFRSQLILAAISSPQANLNDLIDEAIALMSEGVSFGSRESLKKSLTGARKQAENGGLKLKCYKSANKPIKNLAYNKLVRPPQMPTMGNGEGEEKEGEVVNGPGGKGAAGNVLQLLALAKVGGEGKKKSNRGSLLSECQSPPFSSPGSLLDSSSGFQSASSNFSSSPVDLHQSPNSNSALLITMMAAAAAALGNNGGGIGGGKKGGPNFEGGRKQKQQQMAAIPQAAISIQSQNAQIIQRKKARVNSIFNRLSTKAAAAAASSSSSSSFSSSNSASASSGHCSPSSGVEMKAEEGDSMNGEFGHQKRKGAMGFGVAAGTQTEEMEEFGTKSAEDCSCKCRVVRVCCCGNRANCTGGQKRKWEEAEMDGEEDGNEHQGRSPPPSSCSSVENQPQNNHQKHGHQHLISPVKEATE